MNPYLFLILQIFYLMLPGIVGNMMPIFLRNKLSFMDLPVDFNKTWKGKRLLGDHKTLRGFVVGISSAVIVSFIQSKLFSIGLFKELSLIDYGSYPLLSGLVLGAGVLIGDSFESFIKRQKGIPPGKSWFPWDQIDSSVGALVFICLIWVPPIKVVLIALLLSFIFHIVVRRVGLWLGLNDGKS